MKLTTGNKAAFGLGVNRMVMIRRIKVLKHFVDRKKAVC